MSNIIVRTDNQELREKALTVDKVNSEICRERSLYLIDNSKKMKQQHLNNGKLHLNQKGARILSDIYLRGISKILNWCETGNFAGFEEFMSEKSPISIDEIIDWKSMLKSIRGDNKRKLIFAHLNIRSIRNGNIDVLMISETKIDGSFPIWIFLLTGYSALYRSSRRSKGGTILVYVREDISSNLLSIENKPMEGFYVDLSLHKNKWLVNCSYNPHKSSIDNHLLALGNSLDAYSSTNEKIVILGDFKVGKENNYMKLFCESYNLKTVIKEPTCFKNADSSTCINLILTLMNHNISDVG